MVNALGAWLGSVLGVCVLVSVLPWRYRGAYRVSRSGDS